VQQKTATVLTNNKYNQINPVAGYAAKIGLFAYG